MIFNNLNAIINSFNHLQLVKLTFITVHFIKEHLYHNKSRAIEKSSNT
jgi:hypothetical protein